MFEVEKDMFDVDEKFCVEKTENYRAPIARTGYGADITVVVSFTLLVFLAIDKKITG
jgi:hypothetical protein